jgi:hypothetical protein
MLIGWLDWVVSAITSSSSQFITPGLYRSKITYEELSHRSKFLSTIHTITPVPKTSRTTHYPPCPDKGDMLKKKKRACHSMHYRAVNDKGKSEQCSKPISKRTTELKQASCHISERGMKGVG